MRFNPIIANDSDTEGPVIFSPPPEFSPEEQERQRAAVRQHEQEREERHKAFLAENALSPEPIVIGEDEMGIILKFCYDNSDSMTDYFDRHASFGVDLLLAKCPKGAKTEKRARTALALYPELAALEWKWKTENYSMGHGNYLESGGFEFPFKTGLQHYRGSAVTHGHYEITFDKYSEKVVAYKHYPGVRGRMAPPQGGPKIGEGIPPASITLKENVEKKGLEIYFPSVPSEAVRTELKANGWRWSRFGGCWYIRQSTEARAFAEAFVVRSLNPAAPVEMSRPSTMVAPAQAGVPQTMPIVSPEAISVPQTVHIVSSQPEQAPLRIASLSVPLWRQMLSRTRRC